MVIKDIQNELELEAQGKFLQNEEFKNQKMKSF
jgi:hypothetical protein